MDKSKVKELEDVSPIEVMLVLQIISHMFIIGEKKGARHDLKGHCLLVPPDLKKIQCTLPRNSNDEHLINLALKQID